jgi:hypothetical protein
MFAQFMCEGNFVHDLENPWPKPTMEPVGSIDDPCCDFIFFHTANLRLPVRAAKKKITQRRQAAKKKQNSEKLSVFAPLRDTLSRAERL